MMAESNPLSLSEWMKDHIGSVINDKRKIDEILQALNKILSSTGHLPTAHSVARGVGYCYFYARLSELIGVRGYKESVSGKGSDIHRVVGLALLDYISDGMPEPIESKLEEYVNKALDDLKLFPVVEQQFVDYDLHIRGAPDAILEDKKSKKAIVIEWKTSGVTPWNYEKVQVLTYALLEAIRLGYDDLRDAINAILGKLQMKGKRYVVKDFKILPVIIRPAGSGELYPHPALAPQEKIKERYKEIEEYLHKIPIMAEHLTVLLTDIRRLTGRELEEFKIPHPAKKGVKANVLTLMPLPDKLSRGSPREQNRFPCVSRSGSPICNLTRPCKFYYGREINEWEAYERTLWGVRFDVLHEKEKNLLTYKALYHIFRQKEKEDVLEKLKKGCGLFFKIPDEVFLMETFDRKKATKKLIAEREVYCLSYYAKLSRSKDMTQKRLDILDYVKFVDGRIEGYRQIEEYERNDDIIYVIGEGKPVLLSTLDANIPLLSINVFCRVDEVNVEDNKVYYIFSAPSKILEYQMLLFGRYINSYEHLRRNILIAEIDVDLTRLDLEAIDALQRYLKEHNEPAVEESEIEKEIMEIDDFEALGSLLKKILATLRR